MGQTTPINRTFKATIEDRDGWACVVWPESVTFFGSTKSVKVKGAMNGVVFQTAFLPWGDGTQFLPEAKSYSRPCRRDQAMLLKLPWRSGYERPALYWARQ